MKIWTTAPGGLCPATGGEHLVGERKGVAVGPCAACEAEGQVQVDDTDRVFLRLGNYEFEIVRHLLTPEHAAQVADLLQRQLNGWRAS